MTVSIDSAPGPDAGERPDGSAASGSYDAGRAEQAATEQPGGRDTGSQPEAEVLTREEHADEMRDSGPPIQDSQDGQEAILGAASRSNVLVARLSLQLIRSESVRAIKRPATSVSVLRTPAKLTALSSPRLSRGRAKNTQMPCAPTASRPMT